MTPIHPGAHPAGQGHSGESAPVARGIGALLWPAVPVLGVLAALLGFLSFYNFPGVSVGGTRNLYEAGAAPVSIGLFVFAALLAAIALLPRQTEHRPVVAAASLAGFVILLFQTVGKGPDVTLASGAYVVLLVGLLQAVAATAAVLLDAGVVSAPGSRCEPQFGQPAGFGAYGGVPGPYGQPGPPPFGGPQGPGGPPQQYGPPPQGAPGQQYGYGPGPQGGYGPGGARPPQWGQGSSAPQYPAQGGWPGNPGPPPHQGQPPAQGQYGSPGPQQNQPGAGSYGPPTQAFGAQTGDLDQGAQADPRHGDSRT